MSVAAVPKGAAGAGKWQATGCRYCAGGVAAQRRAGGRSPQHESPTKATETKQRRRVVHCRWWVLSHSPGSDSNTSANSSEIFCLRRLGVGVEGRPGRHLSAQLQMAVRPVMAEQCPGEKYLSPAHFEATMAPFCSGMRRRHLWRPCSPRARWFNECMFHCYYLALNAVRIYSTLLGYCSRLTTAA